MSSLLSRDELFVKFYGHPEYHARIVLAPVADAEHVILTPDGDIYIENYADDSVDVEEVRLRPPGLLPFGLQAAACYDFAVPPTPAQLDVLVREGAGQANRERAARGLAPVAAPANVAIALLLVEDRLKTGSGLPNLRQ